MNLSMLSYVQREFGRRISGNAAPPVRRRSQRRRKLRMERVAVVALGAVLALSFVTLHAAAAVHEGGCRAVAERLTRAIAQHNADEIREIFAPGLGDDVTKDLRIGALADRFSALGELREVRVEQAGHGSSPWTLLATFTNGTQIEHVSFAGDHVVSFGASLADMKTAPVQ